MPVRGTAHSQTEVQVAQQERVGVEQQRVQIIWGQGWRAIYVAEICRAGVSSGARGMKEVLKSLYKNTYT